MFGILDKIINYFEERKMRKICSNIQISERGKYVINYLRDITDNKDVYIEAYEEVLTPLMQDGMSRVDAAKLQLSIFEALKEFGANFNN